MPLKHLAKRHNFYEGSHESMQTIHSSDITFPWIKPEKSENFIIGEHYMIHFFNSIYLYTQPLPSVLLEWCLLNGSWIKCTEAIGLKWKIACVSSKWIWHHASGDPDKKRILSQSPYQKLCFSSTTSSFFSVWALNSTISPVPGEKYMEICGQ